MIGPYKVSSKALRSETARQEYFSWKIVEKGRFLPLKEIDANQLHNYVYFYINMSS